MSDVQELPRSVLNRSQRKVAQAEKELEDLIAQETEGSTVEVENSSQEIEAKEPEKEEELSAEEKSFKKRYGDLRRFQQQKEKELQAIIDKQTKQLEGAHATQLPKTEEEVLAWVTKYPDVAAIVESLADKKAKERDEDLDTRLRQIEEMRDSLEAEKSEQELIRLHPDFEEIRNTDAFHTWAEAQPKWIQNALYEDTDVKAAARAIDLYKLDKGIKKTQPDKSAAMSVNTRTRVTPQENEKDSWYSESQIQRMSDKEFASKMEEIEKAQREGKFRYDLSQKAR